MSRVRAISLGAATNTQATGRWRLARTLALALATLVVGGVAAIPGHSSPSASAIQGEALARARAIRAEVTAKYRHGPGRKLAVTEATSTGVVETITLITDWLEPERVVPAGNGIYFAICSVRAKCPYPVRSAAWPAEASLPRLIALELAVRTFLETSADLVVVALPTARPTWVVFERDDLQATVDARAVLNQLASNSVLTDRPLPELVDRLTRPRLFLPLPILPPPDHTIYAVRLFGP
jgi:hypothetical protein